MITTSSIIAVHLHAALYKKQDTIIMTTTITPRG